MTQRTNIIIVAVVALIALVLWSVPQFLPEPETPAEAPPADDGSGPALPDTPVEAPERPDFTATDPQPDLSDARRSTADGLYRDLKAAADSIGEARDRVRLTDKPQYTLPELKRAEEDEEEETTVPEPDPEL